MAQTEKPNIARYRERMDKAFTALKEEFGSLRTGRASAGLLDQITVEAYGSHMPISQVGAVSVPDPRSITVSVWDKGLVVSVEKAIRASGLGLNPVVEGQNLRIPIPPLTEERRKELVKVVRHKAEEAKIAVRNLRRSGRHELDALQKDGSLSTDELERVEKDLEKITHEQVGAIDQLLAQKERELLQV